MYGQDTTSAILVMLRLKTVFVKKLLTSMYTHRLEWMLVYSIIRQIEDFCMQVLSVSPRKYLKRGGLKIQTKTWSKDIFVVWISPHQRGIEF